MKTREEFVGLVRVEPNTGCWIWQHKVDRKGYGRTWWNGREGFAHRLAFVLWRGPIPDAMGVLHKCDTPPCCNPEHLFLGTQRDNMADKTAKGRQQRGERCWKARLTAEQVAQIKAAHGATQAAIAAIYGVTREAVSRIRCGRNWAWVTPATVEET